MAKYSYVVISNPTPGKEEEYNTWYNQQHLPDILNTPGFVAAQRFKIAQPENPLSGNYLAIYEMETDDPAAAFAELQVRAGTPALVISDALDPKSITRVLVSPITERVTRK